MNGKINIGKINPFMCCSLSKESEVEETEEEKG